MEQIRPDLDVCGDIEEETNTQGPRLKWSSFSCRLRENEHLCFKIVCEFCRERQISHKIIKRKCSFSHSRQVIKSVFRHETCSCDFLSEHFKISREYQ